jgi:DNA repair exonuclease SbcCD ATPase subunit
VIIPGLLTKDDLKKEIASIKEGLERLREKENLFNKLYERVSDDIELSKGVKAQLEEIKSKIAQEEASLKDYEKRLEEHRELKEGVDFYWDEEGFSCDIKERDPKFKKIMEEVNKEAEERASDWPKDSSGNYQMGHCHAVWGEKKRILKEKYNIDWYSPAELNPFVIID